MLLVAPWIYEILGDIMPEGVTDWYSASVKAMLM